MVEALLVIFAAVWVIPSILIAWLIGSKKNVGFFLTLCLCLFTSPLIGLFVALISSKKDPERDRVMEDEMFRYAQELHVADEIKKLHQLKENGIISPQEFEQQKIKLLEGSSASSRPF